MQACNASCSLCCCVLLNVLTSDKDIFFWITSIEPKNFLTTAPVLTFLGFCCFSSAAPLNKHGCILSTLRPQLGVKLCHQNFQTAAAEPLRRRSWRSQHLLVCCSQSVQPRIVLLALVWVWCVCVCVFCDGLVPLNKVHSCLRWL